MTSALLQKLKDNEWKDKTQEKICEEVKMSQYSTSRILSEQSIIGPRLAIRIGKTYPRRILDVINYLFVEYDDGIDREGEQQSNTA